MTKFLQNFNDALDFYPLVKLTVKDVPHYITDPDNGPKADCVSYATRMQCPAPTEQAREWQTNGGVIFYRPATGNWAQLRPEAVEKYEMQITGMPYPKTKKGWIEVMDTAGFLRPRIKFTLTDGTEITPTKLKDYPAGSKIAGWEFIPSKRGD